MKLKVGDYIIAAAVVLVAALLFLQYFGFSRAAGKAVIEIDGKPIASYALNPNDDRVETVQTGELHFQIRLKNGKIAITDIDCPDKICVKTGYIGKTGQSIVCLPNKVIIKTYGKTDEGDADIVAK